MALYWNLNLLRLQAMQIGVFPTLRKSRESFQDDLPAVKILNKPSPQVTSVKSSFEQMQSAVLAFRVGVFLHAVYKSTEME